MSHDRNGIERGLRKNDRKPADGEKKLGDIKSAVRRN
jgi:hypothetical protein